MRISDWSSDVCSSDLLRIETDNVERRVADRDRGGDAELRHQVQQREEKGRAIPPAPFAVARDQVGEHRVNEQQPDETGAEHQRENEDRKSTRLNSSH